jgi:predicted PurR-regulated permease PerM
MTPSDTTAPTTEAVVGPDSDCAPLSVPMDTASVSLAVLAALGCVWALHMASVVVIPVLLGMVVSYALNPVVDRLERLRIPRALGAALLLCLLGGGAVWTAYSLSDDATTLVESLPDATQKVRDVMLSRRGKTESAIDKVQRAAAQLEQAAQGSAVPAQPNVRGVTRVSIERAHFNIKDYLWSGTLGFVAWTGQAVVVLFLSFFLLASGSQFRRKMVKIAGPTFAQKRITVQVLDEITAQIHRYLLAQVAVSVIVGVLTGLAFWGLGLEHAVVWGVGAAVLNLVPYIGGLALTGGAALVAFVQFSSVDMAMAVAGVSIFLHTLTGQLLTPWLNGRSSRLNALCAFVGVLAFGALWGVWGLLLGVPVLAAVKAVCDRVDGLQPIGELLGS